MRKILPMLQGYNEISKRAPSKNFVQSQRSKTNEKGFVVSEFLQYYLNFCNTTIVHIKCLEKDLGSRTTSALILLKLLTDKKDITHSYQIFHFPCAIVLILS